jgi:hypothetical protein
MELGSLLKNFGVDAKDPAVRSILKLEVSTGDIRAEMEIDISQLQAPRSHSHFIAHKGIFEARKNKFLELVVSSPHRYVQIPTHAYVARICS